MLGVTFSAIDAIVSPESLSTLSDRQIVDITIIGHRVSRIMYSLSTALHITFIGWHVTSVTVCVVTCLCCHQCQTRLPIVTVSPMSLYPFSSPNCVRHHCVNGRSVTNIPVHQLYLHQFLDLLYLVCVQLLLHGSVGMFVGYTTTPCKSCYLLNCKLTASFLLRLSITPPITLHNLFNQLWKMHSINCAQ